MTYVYDSICIYICYICVYMCIHIHTYMQSCSVGKWDVWERSKPSSQTAVHSVVALDSRRFRRKPSSVRRQITLS